MAADTALGRQQITRGQCQFCRSKIWLLLPSPTVEPGMGCNRTPLTGRQAADSFTLSVLVKCDNYTDPSAPSLPSSQKMESLIIYISFQFHFSTWGSEEVPGGANRENPFQKASPRPGLSLLHISVCLVTRVTVTGWHGQGAVAFKPFSFFRKQNQPGSPRPSVEAGRACIQSVLIELALK